MYIVQIRENKKQYLDLLLLGDEQESMIDAYIESGEMFVLQDRKGAAAAVAVVSPQEGSSVELKNLAVRTQDQGKGYGRLMIEYVCSRYSGKYRTLFVGTGNSDSTVGFYKHCGFSYSHCIKDFFTDNYDHPIYENGVLLEDMVYLKRELAR